jgi:tRNA (guanine-N7-)-methyltransferase
MSDVIANKTVAKTNVIRRSVQSFVRRARKLTTQRSAMFTELWKSYGLDTSEQVKNFATSFTRSALLNLEIGFGTGDALWEMATCNPEENFIGIEVYKPGIVALFNKLKIEPKNNIRIFCEDAKAILTQCIADESLARILIFFPDPWPKRRHFKRRLIQIKFIQLLYSKLKINGYVHIATDWEDYASHVVRCFQANNNFKRVLTLDNNFLQRPATKFAKRGQNLGHEIADLVFVKIS